MRFVIGIVVSLAVGAGCRFFDIPVPSPPVVPGAILVIAMTLGYSATNRLLQKSGVYATTSRLCGGPVGTSSAIASPALGERRSCSDNPHALNDTGQTGPESDCAISAQATCNPE